MYPKHKPDDTQLAFDFYLPFGGRLNPENRWVVMASLIPWEEFEEQYAAGFPSPVGRPAKPFRCALGALIIKERLKLSDEETVEQLRENPYLQYFIGLEGFSDEPPFDPSLMVHFRKRITQEMLAEINERIVLASLTKDSSSSQDSEPPTPPSSSSSHGTDIEKEEEKSNLEVSNCGKLVLDATVAPADIRYPTDTGLLNDARKKSERIIDLLYGQNESVKQFFNGRKPRTYRKNAAKDFATFSKLKKPSKKKIRRCKRKQLSYLRRNINTIYQLLEAGASLDKLPSFWYKNFLVLQELHRQQDLMFRERSKGVQGRIVSLSQPHVRPIVRGKAGKSTEFGAKLSASYVDGFVFIEKVSWDNYNESCDLVEEVERYRKRFGSYPESVHVDKIYRTRDNRKWCQERGIRLSGPRLGRPQSQVSQQEKVQRRQDEGYRSRVEGSFGVGKRKYGLGRLTAKLSTTATTQISLIALVMNLDRLCAALFIWLFSVCQWLVQESLNLLTLPPRPIQEEIAMRYCEV